MTTDQVALARRRLGLGITNVGFWVLAATAVLGWLAWGRGVSTSRVLPVFALVSIAVQAIFDGVGGWWLAGPAIWPFSDGGSGWYFY